MLESTTELVDREFLHSLGGSFCGVGATQIALDFYLWEMVLNDSPDIESIFELGTAYGGFSLFLKMQTFIRGMKFYTYDNIDHDTAPLSQLFGRPNSRPPTGHAWFDDSFFQIDLLQDSSIVIENIERYGKVILFCDNGHKAKEVALYEPALREGSLLIVHDWEIEIQPEDIPSHLTPVYEDFCDRSHSLTRVFRK